jgi:uncharacterized repeat protein (TIGR03847 family)
VPLEEEFRVGTMGLGWDADSKSIVVELLAVTEEEVDESVVLDDTERALTRCAYPLAGPRPRRSPTRAERVCVRRSARRARSAPSRSTRKPRLQCA